MLGYEAIELTIVYSAEAFEKEAESLAKKYNDIESNNDGFPFFFQRNVAEAYEYYTFSIYGTHYAVAYKVNESEYSISYLFFENQTLSYLTLLNAMECCDYHSVQFS